MLGIRVQPSVECTVIDISAKRRADPDQAARRSRRLLPGNLDPSGRAHHLPRRAQRRDEPDRRPVRPALALVEQANRGLSKDAMHTSPNNHSFTLDEAATKT